MARPSKLYLVCYNSLQALGWFIALLRLLPCLAPPLSVHSAYAVAGDLICFLQTCAILETIHAAIGLVPTAPLLAFLQWGGRAHFVLAVVRQIPEEKVSSKALLTTVLLLTTAKLIFILAILSVWTMYQALPFVKKRNLYSGFFKKFSMSYHSFLVLRNMWPVCLHIVGFSFRYLHEQISPSDRLRGVVTLFQQGSSGLNSIGFAVIRKGCLKLRCYAIGDELDGPGRINHPFNKHNNGPVFQGLDASGASFRTVGAEITQETGDFFVSDAEGDPDKPTNGFSSIDQAINALREGKFVIAVDDENGDNGGDLIMAATLVNPESIAFMIRNGSGIISVGMEEEDLTRLMIPMMSPITEIEDISTAASTVTVDARVGISTGVSAADRAKTILTLASPDSKPSDLRRPGHIFPLKYRKGGVLKRAGHTEASVDLVALAGLHPVSVLSTVMDPNDGSMAGITVLQQMAMKHDIPIVSIADLIRYRRKREKLVELIAVSRLPTKWGLFRAYCYQSKLDGTEHIAVVKGDIGDGEDVLVRVHSECLTGDILGSARCDCGNQLDLAMQLIEKAGRGVLVYLRGHEGRGIGLGQKLRAYNLQDEGHDTVEANVELGLAVDSREYGIGAQILRDIGVRTMRLMTNNPAKFIGLKGYGLAVVGRVPVISPITEENQKYLETKRTKMGHVYGSDLPGSLPEEFANPQDTAADKEDDTQN
ncbi:putative monofunctional riboflavin biosynthesis protein RIBA 3, chloroplastic [Dichanthelium oligosanthes]|uniref:Putative monofunctional riboflavin biosynthesis protein RIBA 3, chloroplastic n=1 Tax=Dichanthelium oligosanthes TaxID=888268 RepID=A0A1E5W133_9POAL|nr:putative monofunctional riboflavin biosynthesis protein RIBA 3, chloroplastic [Dichanthelium oligosanthes]